MRYQSFLYGWEDNILALWGSGESAGSEEIPWSLSLYTDFCCALYITYKYLPMFAELIFQHIDRVLLSSYSRVKTLLFRSSMSVPWLWRYSYKLRCYFSWKMILSGGPFVHDCSSLATSLSYHISGLPGRQILCIYFCKESAIFYLSTFLLQGIPIFIFSSHCLDQLRGSFFLSTWITGNKYLKDLPIYLEVYLFLSNLLCFLLCSGLIHWLRGIPSLFIIKVKFNSAFSKY